ncbi:hypothetical protein BGX21_008441 [Mortierella sp. AD011]|nr:hypothetical protein BGX21_008441 [Mortierella sp. AD011]
MTVHSPSSSKPKILIVGAGLGGLTLAILLERAGIDYQIYEKSTTLKTPGGATALSPHILQAMEQLGLLEDLKKISKPTHGYDIFKEGTDGQSLEAAGEFDISIQKSFTGYQTVVLQGAELHNFLLSRVPNHKIEYGKRVLSMSQETNNGVLIRTSDGATHQGDILIGCDGVYSAVRQSLYKSLAKEGVLPSSDAEDLRVSHISFLGVTNPIDPAIAPCITDELSHCYVVIGKNKLQTWRCFTVPGNRICWRVDAQLQSSDFYKSDAFRNSVWDFDAIKHMDESWRAFKTPLGPDGGYLTIGDLINYTPKEQISKTVLEEKLFTTWYNRRTVLLGDGTTNAMLDAVILANELYEIAEDATTENIHNAFKEYYKERYHHAKTDFEFSQRVAKITAGQTKTDVIVRKAVYTYMMTSFKPKSDPKLMCYRPQASFLPKIENRGSGGLDPQKESKRYQLVTAGAAV